jgi:hypothetical protein
VNGCSEAATKPVETIEILVPHRASMFALALQIFLGKEHLVKNWLVSALGKVIYFKETIYHGSTKPLLTSQNRVEIRKNEKMAHVFQTCFF